MPSYVKDSLRLYTHGITFHDNPTHTTPMSPDDHSCCPHTLTLLTGDPSPSMCTRTFWNPFCCPCSAHCLEGSHTSRAELCPVVTFSCAWWSLNLAVLRTLGDPTPDPQYPSSESPLGFGSNAAALLRGLCPRGLWFLFKA